MVALTDREMADRATATYAPVQFGRHRHETPEGYVLWEGVRFARTGPMLYKPDEMPGIEPGPNGMICVERDADVLFHPDTLLSFAGKAITVEHPPTMLDAENHKEYAVGTLLNPRRGEGVDADYAVGDVLVWHKPAIEQIDKGLRQLSAGYDSDVEQISPGLARQTKNVGNHVALVPRGRAGPSCAIQDKETAMATPKKRSTWDRLRTAFKANDEAAFEEELTTAQDEAAESDGNPQRVVIELKTPEAAAPATVDDEGEGEGAQGGEGGDDRLSKLEAAVAQIAETVAKLVKGEEGEQQVGDEDGDDDEAGATNDEDPDEKAETTKAAAMDAMSKAEILAPGIKLPKFDSATGPNAPILALKRQALKTAYAGKAKTQVDAVLAGRAADFDKMPGAIVAVMFDAASALVRAENNSGARSRPLDIPQGPMTAARLQARIAELRKQ